MGLTYSTNTQMMTIWLSAYIIARDTIGLAFPERKTSVYRVDTSEYFGAFLSNDMF